MPFSSTRSSLLSLVLLLTGCPAAETAGGKDPSGEETGGAEPKCDEGLTETLGGLAFASICPGTFEMGCTAGQGELCEFSENLHTVTLTHGYWMKVTEVTHAEFAAVTGLSPSYFDCGDACPVENVTWHMAAAYANALSAAEGLTQCYDCTGEDAAVSCVETGDPYACPGYRLPTDAEWERAARCEEDTMFAGSDTLDEVGWYETNAGDAPRPVATLAPNRCGVYDMSGNIGEWVQDAWNPELAGATDPYWGTLENYRTARLGYFADSYLMSRVAARWPYDPTTDNGGIGIRIVRLW